MCMNHPKCLKKNKDEIKPKPKSKAKSKKNVATKLRTNSNLSEYIFTTDAYGLSEKKAAEKFVTSYWDKPRKIRGYKDGSFSVMGGTHQYKIYFIPSDKKTHPDMYGITKYKKDNPLAPRTTLAAKQGKKINCWKDNTAGHSKAAKEGWITRRSKAKDKIAIMAAKQEVKTAIKGKITPSLIKVSYSSDGNSIYVKSPYNPEMSALGRGLGGKWDSIKKQWIYDARLESKLKSAYEKMYGMWIDPIKDPVNIIIKLSDFGRYQIPFKGDAIFVAGRLVAERRSWSTRVKLGDGVILLTGGFREFGGSEKNISLYWDENTTLEMLDVPKAKAVELMSKSGGTITIDQSLLKNPLTVIKAKAILSQAKKKFGKANVTSLGHAIKLLSGKIIRPIKPNPSLSKAVKIYDDVLAIEAKKGTESQWPKEEFRHDFKPSKGKASVYGLPDGSILIKSKKRLWKKFNY